MENKRLEIMPKEALWTQSIFTVVLLWFIHRRTTTFNRVYEINFSGELAALERLRVRSQPRKDMIANMLWALLKPYSRRLEILASLGNITIGLVSTNEDNHDAKDEKTMP